MTIRTAPAVQAFQIALLAEIVVLRRSTIFQSEYLATLCTSCRHAVETPFKSRWSQVLQRKRFIPGGQGCLKQQDRQIMASKTSPTSGPTTLGVLSGLVIG